MKEKCASGFCTVVDKVACELVGGWTQGGVNGITYCYMFVGIPNGVNFYA